MGTTVNIVELTTPQEKSNACASIIRELPDWFGIPEANVHYITNIADKDAFAANDGEQTVGLIALKYHFQKNAEIWWMGILPAYQGQGVGADLFKAAQKQALQQGCKNLLVTTLSDRSDDVFYKKTRNFYTKMGFRPFLEYNEHDKNPMMWMTLKL